jgi:hypothetical protein
MLSLAKTVERKFLKGIIALALMATAPGCYDEVPEPQPTTKKTPQDSAEKAAASTTAPAVLTKPAERAAPLNVPAEPPAPIARAYAAPPGPEEPTLSKVVIRDKREWDLQEAAARSLGKIGAAAVPELTKDLNDRDPEVRERAADVLARIGPAAKQAVPDLIAALEDDDEAVRRSAAIALGQIGPAAADAVPALMRAMKEPADKAKSP